MKRFWADARVERSGQDHIVVLDGRPVRTPAGHELAAESEWLAQALAAEWREAPDPWSPNDLPLTGLVNAAMDVIAPAPAAFAAGLAGFARHDSWLQRPPADDPMAGPVARLVEPLIEAVERRLDTRFCRLEGVMPGAQPPAALALVQRHYASRPPLVLAALSPVVTLSASALAGLALVHGLAPADEVWQAGLAEELLQAERWGEDAEAAASRRNRRSAFDAGVALLALVSR